MRRPALGLALLAAAAAVVPSCGKAQAGFVVVVDADPMMRAMARTLRVRIYNPSTSATISRQMTISAVDPDTMSPRYPLSFTLEAANPTDHIRVEVELPTAPAPLVLRASASFQEGRLLVLPLLALGGCITPACPANQTCGLSSGGPPPAGPPCVTAEARPLDYYDDADVECPAAAHQVRYGAGCVTLPDRM